MTLVHWLPATHTQWTKGAGHSQHKERSLQGPLCPRHLSQHCPALHSHLCKVTRAMWQLHTLSVCAMGRAGSSQLLAEHCGSSGAGQRCPVCAHVLPGAWLPHSPPSAHGSHREPSTFPISHGRDTHSITEPFRLEKSSEIPHPTHPFMRPSVPHPPGSGTPPGDRPAPWAAVPLQHSFPKRLFLIFEVKNLHHPLCSCRGGLSMHSRSTSGVVVSCKIPILATRVRFPAGAQRSAIYFPTPH